MIKYDDFENAVLNVLGRDIRYSVNSNQNEAIIAPQDISLLIAAGPGSGKTTVMVLKILKFIFVDDIEPSSILATTFTRKAATELRSRILKWGNKLKKELKTHEGYSNISANLDNINFKSVIVGTIDSISEDLLSSYNYLEGLEYTIIEDFVANSLMIKTGLLGENLQNDRQLKSFLNHVKGSKSKLNLSMMSQTLLEIKDRIYHDKINLKEFIDKYEHPGAEKAYRAISAYQNDLQERNLFDFSTLEEEFLRKLENKELNYFLNRIKIVMVDEYQDTNLLQESIYFQMADAAVKNGGCIVVVGDDDQSLYRFRGATVDLFKDFKYRIQSKLGIDPLFVNLSYNYRSTKKIVNFCNSYVSLDTKFQSARVKGKEAITPARKMPYHDFPVLGMFRNDIHTLASDLATFIYETVHGAGIEFEYEFNNFKINMDNDNSLGDIAFLCSSPLEQDYKGNKRLPFLLKDELGKFNPQIGVFNPRGQHLGRIPLIELICGLVLECIDPGSIIQKNLKIPLNAVLRFKSWRAKALNYMNDPHEGHDVKIFVDTWRYELVQEEMPIVDIISKLIELMPEIHRDDELVYIEIITKAITQTGLFSDFRANIFVNNKENERNSVIESLWNIFVPIALGAVGIDLDILENLPENRINIMSIHQAKGLEFDITIVDIGSEFKMNYARDSFRRFPGTPGKSCTIEDKMRAFSPLGKHDRDGIDRSFDDIIRQYFVAFSRPKNILLLVGLNSVKNGYYFNGDIRYVPNIASGWDRDMKWHWKGMKNIFHI
ncbi:UvrD-helicase domain-containing protein [Methanobacterium sp. ACI-7]|uniref:UvrD-helicase domain-containing protein n=1 Tax=unclassified Methanobacterium TaxID=2627676 RepID=UPI0039C3DCC1